MGPGGRLPGPATPPNRLYLPRSPDLPGNPGGSRPQRQERPHPHGHRHRAQRCRPRVLPTRGWERLSLPGGTSRGVPVFGRVTPSHKEPGTKPLCADSPQHGSARHIPGHARPGVPVPAAPCGRLSSAVPRAELGWAEQN